MKRFSFRRARIEILGLFLIAVGMGTLFALPGEATALSRNPDWPLVASASGMNGNGGSDICEGQDEPRYNQTVRDFSAAILSWAASHISASLDLDNLQPVRLTNVEAHGLLARSKNPTDEFEQLLASESAVAFVWEPEATLSTLSKGASHGFKQPVLLLIPMPSNARAFGLDTELDMVVLIVGGETADDGSGEDSCWCEQSGQRPTGPGCRCVQVCFGGGAVCTHEGACDDCPGNAGSCAEELARAVFGDKWFTCPGPLEKTEIGMGLWSSCPA